jgi:hypothetical protein
MKKSNLISICYILSENLYSVELFNHFDKIAGIVICVDGKRICQGYLILYPKKSTVISRFEDRNCNVPFQYIAQDQSEMEQSRQQQIDLKLGIR